MIHETEHPYIVRNDEILSGEPIIKGTRTSVRAIVETWRMGALVEEIPSGLPHLTMAQVFDALSYFSDHQIEIISYIERNRVPDALIHPAVRGSRENHYPLRGTTFAYRDPAEPVAQADWELNKEEEKTMTTKTLDDHIVSTPGTLGGKPRIAGRRIGVHHIMIWHELMGRSADELAADYDLTLADVYAALAYYFDHREEIDAQIQEDEEFVESLRRQAQDPDPRQAHEEAH